MKNALTFDLEDWFCVSNLSHCIDSSEWDSQELRVGKAGLEILDLLDNHSTKATFFVLGWVAGKIPDLIREIAERGHEVATHGYSHRLLTDMTPKEFEKDLVRALEITHGIVTQQVIGYRAPTFSVTSKTLWAIDILQRNGILYDSSIFPMSFLGDYKDIPNLSQDVFLIQNKLIEFPISCAQRFSLNIPCGGGCFFRILPYPLFRYLLKSRERQGRSIMFYLHPWEIDPGQPRIKMPLASSVRHYTNLNRTMERLDRLLHDFTFTTARKVLGL